MKKNLNTYILNIIYQVTSKINNNNTDLTEFVLFSIDFVYIY